MIVQGSHTFAMFIAHAHMRNVKNGEYPLQMTLTTFTQFAQSSTAVSMHASYGSTIHCRAQEGYQSSSTIQGLCILLF